MRPSPHFGAPAAHLSRAPVGQPRVSSGRSQTSCRHVLMTGDVAMVLELERSRLRALVERDMVVAERIHAADYQLITPGGHTHTKVTYLGDVASRRLEYLVFEPTSPIAVRATNDLIVLRYVARIRLSVEDAEEVELTAWHTDHYEKRDGTWALVWSQATETAA